MDAAVSNDGEQPETFFARRQEIKAKGINGNGMGTPLAIAAKAWPTPSAKLGDDRRGFPSPELAAARIKSGRSNLDDAVSNWPTPTSRDWKDTGNLANVPENGLLGRVAANWSTPRATDGEKGGPNQSFGAGGTPLPAQAMQWSTPTVNGNTNRKGSSPTSQDGLRTPGGRPLFPPGPSDLSGWRGALERAPELEPAFRRVADGLASRLDVARVDRLRMLGNGVVPLEAAYAIRTLWARFGMQSMTATARATSQPETFYFDRERSPGVTITLPSIDVDEDRNQYLREGIAKMIRRARRYMRAKDGEGTRWTEGYAGRIIEWALLLKEEGLVQAATADVGAPIDHPGREVAASDEDRVIEDSTSDHAGSLNQPITDAEKDTLGITDPIVHSLIETHRTRKIFPAGHTFAMTNPVINGHMVTLGTCSCGETFSYAYGSAGHERMDAAIEAHWQKFDATADKIDGRGEPIGGEAPAVKPKRKKKSQPDAIGQPASIASAPDSAGIHGADAPSSDIADAAPRAMRSEPAPHAPPSGAGSTLLEDAPIGAGLVAADMAAEPQDDWSELLRAATDLAWREPQPITETQKMLLDFGKVYAHPREVERPVLRYLGGKFRLAPWIISHFPPHRVYVEPFGGAASVLLRKPRSAGECYNDIDGNLVNLFAVLRDLEMASELCRRLVLTPFARDEYDSAFETTEDPIERARRLIVRSYMGHGSSSAISERSTGFRASLVNRGGALPAGEWPGMPGALQAITDRIQGVLLECRPALQVIERYDAADTLIYLDPPYVQETRSAKRRGGRAFHAYAFELSDDDHVALLDRVLQARAMIVISGYSSALYEEKLSAWRREVVETHADGALDRTEVLWLNPRCAEALDELNPPLFNMAELIAANTPPPPRRQQPSGG